MTLTPFVTLRNSSLPYNWTTVLVGWRGVGVYYRLVSSEEVISYSDDQLSAAPNDKFDAVLELSQATSDDVELINNTLNALASPDTKDLKDAKRTWQLILLKDILTTLTNDPVSSLTELSGFWAGFDYPSDGPHIVQGKNNTIAPQDYYTEQNLKQIIDKHLKWIRQEEEILKNPTLTARSA